MTSRSKTGMAGATRFLASVALRLALVLAPALLPLGEVRAAPEPGMASGAARVEPRLPAFAPLSDSPPTISLSVPAEISLGADVNFSVTFNNNDPVDAGFGPVIDVLLDTTGADGDDGLGTSSISASFAGIPFTTGGANPTMWVLTFDAGGEVTHPCSGTPAAPT